MPCCLMEMKSDQPTDLETMSLQQFEMVLCCLHVPHVVVLPCEHSSVNFQNRHFYIKTTRKRSVHHIQGVLQKYKYTRLFIMFQTVFEKKGQIFF